MLKHLLFTHDDLDGAGCKIIFSLFFDKLEDEFDVVICSNKNVDIMVSNEYNSKEDGARISPEETVIWFADIVASREIMEALKDLGYEVKIFDHHRTNFFVQQIFESAVIIPENDMGVMQSGTSLLYQYLVANSNFNDLYERNLFRAITYSNKWKVANFIGDLVFNIRSYDTFEFKETNNLVAKKLQMFFGFVGIDIFCSRYINKILLWAVQPANCNQVSDNIILADGDLAYVIDQRIVNERDIIDKITPDSVYDIEVNGYKAAFSFPVFGTNVSELAYQFLRKYPEYDIFVQFSWANGGEFSFRTAKEEINCGIDIAEKLGGGGHPKAAGCNIGDWLRDQFIWILTEYLNGNLESKTIVIE